MSAHQGLRLPLAGFECRGNGLTCVRRVSTPHPAKMVVLAVTLILVQLMCTTTYADYQISWHTIDGGGGVSVGTEFEVEGTIGQPDAGSSDAPEFELLGGFWPGWPTCFVDFGDFARFAHQWLIDGAGGDLDSSSHIDHNDLAWFGDYWLRDCPHDWSLR